MFSSYMMTSWEAASIVAVVAGVVGFFTVLRGEAFAAHALPNGAFAGAAGASLIGLNVIFGLGAMSLLGAVTISTLGRRARHDVATALTIVMMLALGALFLSVTREYAPEIYALLFGELLGVGSEQLAPTALIGAAAIMGILLLYRPLLLSSLSPEALDARGISSRWIDLMFLVVIALTTTVAVPVVGALLIFSLMIGPPAAANSLTSRPLIAMLLSVVIALLIVWSAIALAFVNNLPMGFFVGSAGAVAYMVGRVYGAARNLRFRGPRRYPVPVPPWL